MSEVPFHATVQGRRYYEHSLPELIRQLKRIGDGLERLVEPEEAKQESAVTDVTSPQSRSEDQHGQDAKPH